MKKRLMYILIAILVVNICIFGIAIYENCLSKKKYDLNPNNSKENYGEKIDSVDILEKNELINWAYSEANKIFENKSNISIETAQYILYSDEKNCDIEFPIDNSDYYIMVSFSRESINEEWKLNETKKITMNQFLD